jgi:hypothetical protein
LSEEKRRQDADEEINEPTNNNTLDYFRIIHAAPSNANSTI